MVPRSVRGLSQSLVQSVLGSLGLILPGLGPWLGTDAGARCKVVYGHSNQLVPHPPFAQVFTMTPGAGQERLRLWAVNTGGQGMSWSLPRGLLGVHGGESSSISMSALLFTPCALSHTGGTKGPGPREASAQTPKANQAAHRNSGQLKLQTAPANRGEARRP